MSFIFANTVVQMWGVTHADFVAKQWHVFVVYLIVTRLACFVVCCFNRAMPYMTQIGIFLILAGFLITVVVWWVSYSLSFSARIHYQRV